jgi:hypothetical protein
MGNIEIEYPYIGFVYGFYQAVIEYGACTQ